VRESAALLDVPPVNPGGRDTDQHFAWAMRWHLHDREQFWAARARDVS
jgi:hypothetical protein